MIRNRFVARGAPTGPDPEDATVGRLRQIDSVFDAYRVTPGAG